MAKILLKNAPRSRSFSLSRSVLEIGELSLSLKLFIPDGLSRENKSMTCGWRPATPWRTKLSNKTDLGSLGSPGVSRQPWTELQSELRDCWGRKRWWVCHLNSPKATILWLEEAKLKSMQLHAADHTTPKSLRKHSKFSSSEHGVDASNYRSSDSSSAPKKRQIEGFILCESALKSAIHDEVTAMQECEASFHGVAGFSGVSSAHSKRKSTQNVSLWGEMSGLLANRRDYLPHYFNLFKVALYIAATKRWNLLLKVCVFFRYQSTDMCVTSPWDDLHSWNTKQQLSMTQISESDGLSG